jgi:hypothetical protein
MHLQEKLACRTPPDLDKGIVMPSKRCVARNILIALTMAAGFVAAARADDSSLSRFGGEGWRFFDEQRVSATKERSEFRQQNRHGLPTSYYQAMSSWGPAYHEPPVVDQTAPKFRATNPKGLAFEDYQALSSNSGQWQGGSRSRDATGSVFVFRNPIAAGR